MLTLYANFAGRDDVLYEKPSKEKWMRVWACLGVWGHKRSVDTGLLRLLLSCVAEFGAMSEQKICLVL